MQIDRSRFLALTAAIAACNAQPPAAPVVALEIPTTAPTTDAPDAATSAAPTSSAPLVFSRPDSGTRPDDDPPDSCTTANAVGAPADCTKIRRPPAPQCESFDDTVEACMDMTRFLKPAIAEKATKCVVAKSGTLAICQYDVAASCLGQALRGSCADPSTLAECKQIAQQCASARGPAARVTVAECQGALSAVAARHRAAFTSCMTEGCTTGWCLSYLK